MRGECGCVEIVKDWGRGAEKGGKERVKDES